MNKNDDNHVNNSKFDLVIIGTGAAASTVAHECASQGWKVTLIDSRPFGGTCALRGCDPKKVLVAAEETMDWNTRMKGKGISHDANGIHIDWPELMKFKRTFTRPVPKNREEAFAKAGIKPFHGTAQFIEKSKLMIIDSNTYDEEKLTTINSATTTTAIQGNKDVEDWIIEGKYFVIATGAKPRPLGIEGEEKYVTTSDQFLELDQIPKEIVFIGGGYISFELAHIAAHAGCKATILHRSNKVLYPHFDPDLVKGLIVKSRELGIDILLGKEVTKISKKEDTSNKLIVYSKSSADYDVGVENRLSSIETDMVVHGAGRIPNIDNLNLSAADIEYDNRHGIKVNEYLQSISNPNVYAAGDATLNLGGSPLTPVAIYEGQIVSHNLLSNGDKNNSSSSKIKPNYSGIPSVIFTIPTLCSVGIQELEAKEKGIRLKVKHQYTSSWFSSRRIGENHSSFKILLDENENTILGAHLLGHSSEEVINIFALAIRLNIPLRKLKESATLFAYPTNASDIVSML
ncbi:MAG: NAD(P)/FAD-dependent oxidoreductase [Nitrososphaeraceae archaeon]|nr:NAD(P)/FAD-dependent oxidoreductase [Nitrososphaeraceae archaeon]